MGKMQVPLETFIACQNAIASKLALTGIAWAPEIPCGSELARDSGLKSHPNPAICTLRMTVAH
ncbi:conserved hypothetical protein [Pseudomonas brassicacearum]